MSSWDSMGSTGRNLKIKGTSIIVPISWRCLYDTPNMVGYSLHINTKELEKTGRFNLSHDFEHFTLKAWDKENKNIDAREMKDSDVYDLFSTSVEKYADKLEKEGLSVRQMLNLLKKEGIVASYEVKTIEQYKERGVIPPRYLPCQIIDKIASVKECAGFLVNEKMHLDVRKAGALGIIYGYVPGCGGDVWWVKHEDDTIGAYLYTEITDPK